MHISAILVNAIFDNRLLCSTIIAIKRDVWSVALYGCRAGTMGKGERRIEAFEMWCYRKLLKITRVDKVNNLRRHSRGLQKEKETMIRVHETNF